MKRFLLVSILLVLLSIPTRSMARTNVFFSFGIGIFAPVFIAPSPVFVAPPPVVLVPSPVIAQPAHLIITPYGHVIKVKHKIKHHKIKFMDEFEDDDDD